MIVDFQPLHDFSVDRIERHQENNQRFNEEQLHFS